MKLITAMKLLTAMKVISGMNQCNELEGRIRAANQYGESVWRISASD
jgi:hypothetical protein